MISLEGLSFRCRYNAIKKQVTSNKLAVSLVENMSYRVGK